MSDAIERAVNDYYETGIRNLTFQIGNLNGSLNRLMKLLQTEDLNEDQEKALVGMAGQCSQEIHAYGVMLEIEKTRFKIVKESRQEIKELESEDIYYDPSND